MKKSEQFIFILFGMAFILVSCNNPTDHEPIDLSSKVRLDNFEILSEGAFTSQSGSGTQGKIQKISDDSGNFYIRLLEDFKSSFHTGTVTVYLSTSSKLNLNDKNSHKLVSVVDQGGEHFLKIDGIVNPKFTHAILWCGAAAIPFGYAELK